MVRMSNKIQEKIKQYYERLLPQSSKDSQEQTIRKARLKMNRYEGTDSTNSFWDFFMNQFLFIRKSVWIMQFSLTALFVFIIVLRGGDLSPISHISALVPLLFLSWAKELSRSLTYGTAELEITTRFTLRQVLLSRIVIMGLTDIFILTFCSLFSAWKFSLGISQTIMYIFVPFLLTATGCLFILNHLSLSRSNWYCGGWCGMIMISFFYFSYWEGKIFTRALLLGWYVAFFISLILIIIELCLLLRNCSRKLSLNGC